jgi:23S rRNA (guanosine2251-2'-O)-methyltransferase
VAEGKGGRALEHSLNDWCAAIPRAVPPVRRLSDRELGLLVKTEDHQGIAAQVEPYPYLDLETILDNQDLIVALDQIQDPHNLGAIIRTAEATGAGVLIPRHRAAEVTAAVVKASAGATEHAAVAQVRNLADALAQAKEAGFWIYGGAAEADVLYTAEDYQPPTCFVVGSEGRGLSQRVVAACDVMVGLPLTGRTDSLNVSVSAGVLLYEAVRQRAAHSTRERNQRTESRP